jgi:hypothetical protein
MEKFGRAEEQCRPNVSAELLPEDKASLRNVLAASELQSWGTSNLDKESWNSFRTSPKPFSK